MLAIEVKAHERLSNDEEMQSNYWFVSSPRPMTDQDPIESVQYIR
jgi:hypothetical protein